MQITLVINHQVYLLFKGRVCVINGGKRTDKKTTNQLSTNQPHLPTNFASWMELGLVSGVRVLYEVCACMSLDIARRVVSFVLFAWCVRMCVVRGVCVSCDVSAVLCCLQGV